MGSRLSFNSEVEYTMNDICKDCWNEDCKVLGCNTKEKADICVVLQKEDLEDSSDNDYNFWDDRTWS